MSNRAAAGVYEDRSGPVLARLLAEAGCTVDGPLVVPDGAPVEVALRDAITAGYDVVVTTGGTGLTPGDLTPEMTRRVLDREIPGIAEAIRAAGVAGGRPGRDAVPRRGGPGRPHADREPGGLDRRGQGRHGGAGARCCGTRWTRRTAATTRGPRQQIRHTAPTTRARSWLIRPRRYHPQTARPLGSPASRIRVSCWALLT